MRHKITHFCYLSEPQNPKGVETLIRVFGSVNKL